MTTKVDIVSGFLGAGKTTLIKQLLKDISKNEKIVIIENEIGEENIDAHDLRELEVLIKEITSGCICCSLSTNLITILNTISDEGSVNRIIIEPTGLATLSDLLDVFSYINNKAIELNLIITVLDVLELELFAGNFGTFFSDQIRNCKIVLLSKIDKSYQSDIKFARYYASNLNPLVPIIESEDPKISIVYLESLLQNINIKREDTRHIHENKNSFDGFDNITIKPKIFYTKEDILSIFNDIQSNIYGNIIRVKGFLSLDENSSLKIDYVLGQIYITERHSPSESVLVIIGKDLKLNDLRNKIK
jgi:G3E family GTPase